MKKRAYIKINDARFIAKDVEIDEGNSFLIDLRDILLKTSPEFSSPKKDELQHDYKVAAELHGDLSV